MKIMVIGSGGREHAIIKSVQKNKKVSEIYCCPGNGGIAQDATCVDIGACDIENIVKFAVSEKIDYAIVAPDDPLVAGCVDALNNAGIDCFGPNKAAAIIEGSKSFSKNLMKKYNIPTAQYEIFDDAEKAYEYVKSQQFPLVLKADGLALGKGVLIVTNLQEAIDGIKSIMLDKKFGDSGNQIVIEEFLEGPEVSVLAFTDGKTIKPMISSMDHKRALNDDKGLNTGGMGTVAPNPFYTENIAKQCMDEIFIPTMNAMNKENRTFIGCLYFGLMITSSGPKVIEYNCRFGDPETQVVLPLLKSDLLDIMQSCTNQNLADTKVEFIDGHCCCVICASNGYPEKYDKGFELTYPESINDNVFVAGAKLDNNNLVTDGGRVVGVSAIGDSLKEAIELSYDMVDKINFENKYFRSDIGSKAVAQYIN